MFHFAFLPMLPTPGGLGVSGLQESRWLQWGGAWGPDPGSWACASRPGHGRSLPALSPPQHQEGGGGQGSCRGGRAGLSPTRPPVNASLLHLCLRSAAPTPVCGHESCPHSAWSGGPGVQEGGGRQDRASAPGLGSHLCPPPMQTPAPPSSHAPPASSPQVVKRAGRAASSHPVPQTSGQAVQGGREGVHKGVNE